VLVQTGDAHGASLREALSARPELEIVDEVPTTGEAVSAAQRWQPGVLVMDVGLQDVAGHRILRSIRQVAPETRLVLHARAARVDAPGVRRWIARLVDVVLDPAQATALATRLVLADETESVPIARTFLSDLLAQWELEPLVPPAELLVSELVANAVQHVPGACAVEVTYGTDVLRIAVADSGLGMPDLQVLGPTSEGGRGLHIVSAFSTAWGVDRMEDGGKQVWAELSGRQVKTG
jgi:DNA-binding NarL/FixJ family response regulator